MNKTHNIIIVAGGKGLRMGGEIPKQFIPIGGRPVLMRTVETFYEYNPAMKIILVLPSSHQKYWEQLCQEYSFSIPHTIASGGKTRFHSVKNGLEFVSEGTVGVHDGARPFASHKLIATCFSKAITQKAVIPAIASTSSLRQIIDESRSKIIDRSKIVLVQTPQVFHSDILKKAYEVDFDDTFTDDASVVEAMGIDIFIVKGEDTNIKITTPIDLKIGELILDGKSQL